LRKADRCGQDTARSGIAAGSQKGGNDEKKNLNLKQKMGGRDERKGCDYGPRKKANNLRQDGARRTGTAGLLPRQKKRKGGKRAGGKKTTE